MRLSIAEILANASEIEDVKKRREFIINNDSVALRTVLKYCFDPRIKFLLPKGKAPYKPSDMDTSQGMLYSEFRKLYLFVEGGNTNLTTVKREMLFINLLESLHPKDAELLEHVKDKKLPYKSINKNFIEKVYPGLIDE